MITRPTTPMWLTSSDQPPEVESSCNASPHSTRHHFTADRLSIGRPRYQPDALLGRSSGARPRFRTRTNARFCRRGGRRQCSWDSASRHDPLHWLSSDAGDEVVVTVVVHHADTFPLSHGGDQKVRETDSPDLPPVP